MKNVGSMGQFDGPMYVRPDSLDQIKASFDPFTPYKDLDPDKERLAKLWVHEVFPDDPIHYGILLSKAIVEGITGDKGWTKYVKDRLFEEGARRFYRIDNAYNEQFIFGDCGGFSWRNEPTIPVSCEEVADFYKRIGVDYGIAPDHIPRDWDSEEQLSLFEPIKDDSKERVALSLSFAERFLTVAADYEFTPVAPVHGWDIPSTIESFKTLIGYGYEYVAFGTGAATGLRGQKVMAIRKCLELEGYDDIHVHLLGWADIDIFHEDVFRRRVTSFDARSPHTNGFTAGPNSYWTPERTVMYHAIALPQIEKVKNDQPKDKLFEAEQAAMEALVEYNDHNYDVHKLVDLLYQYRLLTNLPLGGFEDLAQHWIRTLMRRPWEECKCPMCQQRGVWVMILRDTQTSWARCFHNWYAFSKQRHRMNLP